MSMLIRIGLFMGTTFLAVAEVIAAPREIRIADLHCDMTTIESIGKRLDTGNPLTDGTVIGYANKVLGISYDRIAAIVEKSNVGDRVKLCLTAKYIDCPKGDTRGRTYRATNLRTGDTWELPDSQHVCGGA